MAEKKKILKKKAIAKSKEDKKFREAYDLIMQYHEGYRTPEEYYCED